MVVNSVIDDTSLDEGRDDHGRNSNSQLIESKTMTIEAWDHGIAGRARWRWRDMIVETAMLVIDEYQKTL